MNQFEQGHIIAEIILAEKERPLTEKEQYQLEEWFKQDSSNYLLYEKLKYGEDLSKSLKDLDYFDTDEAFAAFNEKVGQKKSIKINPIVLRVAAVFILLLGVYYFAQEQLFQDKIQPHEQLAISPGTSKAILKLADGTVVNLENKTAEITESDGTTISSDTNKVVYLPGKNRVKERQLKFNTIEIPRGGEYQLTLSDGTNVWLNSETIIKYPVVFAHNKREVFIEGEAFFDVAHNEEVPFIVSTADMSVKVLGTAFNIRGYKNEGAATTTLVRGKVNVTSTKTEQSFLLNPSQQFITENGKAAVKNVDVNQYIAWKEGRIYFENNTLKEIFTDVARWYNIEVVFASEDLEELRFSVDVKRYDEINEITKIIELTKKVKFEITDETINILAFKN